MKPKSSLKTLYRSPVRTILTFILLAAVTFALFSQVLEHVVTLREVNAAVSEYYGAGAVEIKEPDVWSERSNRVDYLWNDGRVPMETWDELYRVAGGKDHTNLTNEQIDAISSMPYISGVDMRYMTAGVSDKYTRLDEGVQSYDYARNCVIEGTIAEIGSYTHEDWDLAFDCTLYLEDCEILAGNPIWEEDLNGITVTVNCNYKAALEEAAYVQFGFLNSVTAVHYPGYEENYGPDAVRNLNVGDRYVFIVRYGDNIYPDYYKTYGYALTYLTDPFLDTRPGIWHIEGAPENYLETEEYALLKEYVYMVNTDIHTFDVVYTRDMDSIRYVADGTIGIVDGRTITPEDEADNPYVCVISQQVAQAYGLQVGSTITLNLGDKLFDQYRNLGAVAAVPERLSDSYTEVTLEVVGIYTDIRDDTLAYSDPFWSYSKNAIFVPGVLLNVPESELEGHTFAPGEFSFTVDNAWDMEAFELEVMPQIGEMDLTLYFEDGGWLEIAAIYKESEKLSVTKLIVFSTAAAVTMCFTAYLYIIGRRRDYAIMRLLGTTKSKANFALQLPLGVVTIFAVALGSVLAVISTEKSIAESELLTKISQTAVSLDIHPMLIAAEILALTAIVLVVAEIMLGSLGRRTPLELMQTRQQKRKPKKKVAYAPEPETVVLGEWTPLGSAQWDGKKRHTEFVFGYIKRHVYRSKAKSLMFVLVTALLLNITGQMYIMKNSYQQLFADTKITSNFVGEMELGEVFKLKKSDYVGDAYYQTTGNIEINKTYVKSVITTDIERYSEASIDIVYAPGYDDTVMQDISGVLVIPKGILDEYGWKLGETVCVSVGGRYAEITTAAINEYHHVNGAPDYGSMTDAEKKAYRTELTEKLKPDIEAEYAKYTNDFVIAGTFESEILYLNDVVFTPGMAVNNDGYGNMLIPQIIELTVADNSKVEDYRKYAEHMISLYPENITFVMDTSKLDNLENNIAVVSSLIPIITVAVMVIGAFLCGLIIVQTSKDIAIMRVLGTSKRKTRAIIVLEQMILCIIGIIIAVIVLALRGALAQMLWVFGVFALVILSASIVASVAASRKNVLELLQTKE